MPLRRVPHSVSVHWRYLHQDLQKTCIEILSMNSYKHYSKATVYRHMKKEIGAEPADTRKKNTRRPRAFNDRDERRIIRVAEQLRHSKGGSRYTAFLRWDCAEGVPKSWPALQSLSKERRTDKEGPWTATEIRFENKENGSTRGLVATTNRILLRRCWYHTQIQPFLEQPESERRNGRGWR